MLFNSLQFLVFFGVLFVLYYAVVPDRFRWLLLLVASCYFYMAYIPSFILILFFLITVDYILGIEMSKVSGKHRKTLLLISIFTNVGTLFFFKYFNFFNENVAGLAHLLHWNYPLIILNIALPLGLSFHVFQSLSYVIEVYKGRQQPERHYGIYALYVMFFPQLVAGPIERPQHLLHQFHEPHSFNSTNVRRGLELMLWGFFKKAVIADRLALLVDHVYVNISAANNIAVLLSILLFVYQLYCDFSGYSDIAVGSALVFGYDVINNFERPYSSRSIAELWRRWHISLSSWLRDYLYYPIAFAGKGITKGRLYFSLFATFVLIGLWHGANWTYVIFGAMQGVYMICSSMTEKWRKRVIHVLGFDRKDALLHVWQILVTFFLFTLSLIFFRAESVAQAVAMFGRAGNALVHWRETFGGLHQSLSLQNLGLSLGALLTAVLAIVAMELIQYIQARRNTRFILDGSSLKLRWATYYAVILCILFLGYLDAAPFIYFKF